MGEPEPIRVVLADSHPAARDGLAALLGSAEGLQVVGTAADGAEAVGVAGDTQPDVVVMDVDLPGLGGIDATRQVTTDSPHVGVVVLTASEDDSRVFEAMQAGARGYLLRGRDGAEVVRALTAVAHGEVIVGAAMAHRVADYFATTAASDAALAPVFPELTAREREVLNLAAADRSNAQIAVTLDVSPKTVSNTVSNIVTKLQVADRAQAIVRAGRVGLSR